MTLLKIYRWALRWKRFENRHAFDEVNGKTAAPSAPRSKQRPLFRAMMYMLLYGMSTYDSFRTTPEP